MAPVLEAEGTASKFVFCIRLHGPLMSSLCYGRYHAANNAIQHISTLLERRTPGLQGDNSLPGTPPRAEALIFKCGLDRQVCTYHRSRMLH